MASVRPEPLSDAWRDWMRTFGAHLQLLRRFFGLAAAELAAESGVTEGTVTRLEEGLLLELSFIDVIRINRALAQRLRTVDAALLTPEVKGFLQHLDYLAIPDEHGPPAPGGVTIQRFQMFADPTVVELLELFLPLPRERRPILIEMLRTVARELAS
jgi:transcriptional regulator with XRE-family HTH domain